MREELNRYLRLGLGRSILFLKDHDAAPYRDLILHACTHNLALDPQSEGSRASYMFEIIHLTNEVQWYRDAILMALSQIPSPAPPSIEDLNFWDECQLFDFARLFARQGDEEAHQLMYQMFARRTTVSNVIGTEYLIELDGLKGFEFVASRLGNIQLGPDDWLDDWYLELAEEYCGKEALAEFIERKGATNPQMMVYINHVESRRLARALRESATAKERDASLEKRRRLKQKRQEEREKLNLEEIEMRLANTQDQDELHTIELEILDLSEMHPAEIKAETLVALYEQGSCSYCRKKIVALLLAFEALPLWMLEECQYDSNADLRKLVQPLSE